MPAESAITTLWRIHIIPLPRKGCLQKARIIPCQSVVLLSGTHHPISPFPSRGVALTSCTVAKLGRQHVGCPRKTPHLPHSTASGDGGVADDAGFPERDQTDENRSSHPSEVSEVSTTRLTRGNLCKLQAPSPWPSSSRNFHQRATETVHE